MVHAQGEYYEALCKDIDPSKKELVCCFPADAGFPEACFKLSYDILVVAVRRPVFQRAQGGSGAGSSAGSGSSGFGVGGGRMVRRGRWCEEMRRWRTALLPGQPGWQVSLWSSRRLPWRDCACRWAA